MSDPLLRPLAVAELLDVSVSTVECLARDKKIRAVRVEGQWRFAPDDVQLYLAATRREATPGTPQLAPATRRGWRAATTASVTQSGYVPVFTNSGRKSSR